MRLHLASTSPARLMVLRSAGIEPATLSPGVDEEAAVTAEAARLGRAPEADETVQLLARLKAEAAYRALSGSDEHGEGGHPVETLILGGDSAFAFGGQVLGKPHTREVALERWRSQRGGTGVLHSRHWLIDGRTGTGVGAVSTASVTFAADLDDDDLDWYLDSGEPLEVAGAFTLDSLGQAFITRIEGDPGTVIGLSIPLLRELAGILDVRWPSLVRGNPLP